MTPKLHRLPIPVPPQIEESLGYTGECRWLATWWEPAGDEARIADKWTQQDGEWAGFLAYTQHRTVAPILRSYNLGSSDSRAEHVLIFDLQERTAYIAPYNTGLLFLETQDEPKPEHIAALERIYAEGGFEAIQDALCSLPNPVPEITDIMQAIEKTNQVIANMTTWLDEKQL